MYNYYESVTQILIINLFVPMKNFDKIIKKYSNFITKDTVSFSIKTNKFSYTYYPKTDITVLTDYSDRVVVDDELDTVADDLLAA